MLPKLRILMVEDSYDDAELVEFALNEGGYEISSQVVAAEREYAGALAAAPWDVILCDHNLPRFDSIRALKLLQAKGLEIPFIIVSGAIGEEAAVAAMKAGASDYVMKDRLARLVPAIEREMREAAIRRDKRRVESALLLNEARLSGIVGSAMDAIISTGDDQRIVLFNGAAESMFGYTSEQMLGQPIDVLLPERIRTLYRAATEAAARTASTGRLQGELMVLAGLRRGGEEFPIEATVSQIEVSGQRYHTVIARDVTDRERAQQQMASALRQKEVLLREVHHRVKNNLHVVSSLLSLQARTTTDAQAASALQEAITRVQTMALVHNELYGVPDVGSIDFPAYVQRLLEEMELAYVHEPGRIGLELIADRIYLDLETAVPCGLVLHELVTNALKHAFPAGRTGTVQVRLQASPDGRTVIAVKDDGVGLPRDVDYRTPNSMGLDIVHALTEQLGATLLVECEGGTSIGISFATRTNTESAPAALR